MAKKKLDAKKRTVAKISTDDKKRLIVFSSCSLVFLVLALVVGLNFIVVRDVLIGMGYKPSLEMASVRDSLGLTDKGVRIFNASLPELLEKTEFNRKCRETENETAILGCYTEDKIYIYNIVDEELPGIRELATAHELLHAVYGRMGDSEKMALVEPLTRVFEANQELLGSEIDSYPVSEKQEELYVRAGTEIKDLPTELEAHYAEVFSDQDKIVDFYNSYIKVFLEIEKKLSELLAQIGNLKGEIDTKTSSYEASVEELNAKIKQFNECAGTLNCFTSGTEFNRRRAELISEQEKLKGVYNEINTLIAKYNALVGEYNENILHGQALNMRINSSENVEEVED